LELNKPILLYFIDTLQTGGAEKSLLQIAAHFKKFTPIIVTLHTKRPNMEDEAESLGVKVVNLNVPSRLWWIKARQPYKKLLAELKPQLVHAHLFKAEQVARMYTPKSIPVWGAFVNEPYSEQRFKRATALQRGKIKFYQYWDSFTAKRVQHFTALTQAIIPTNCSALNVPTTKVTVLPRGRDVAVFTPYQPSLEPNSPLRLVVVARLLHRKGYAEILKAVELVINSGIPLHLTVVGDGVDAAVIKKAATPLKDVVEFVGTQKNIVPFLHRAHVFIFASHYEGFGGALIEAMLCAKPVIVSNINVFQELVVAEKTGYFFDVGNAESLAQKIIWVQRNYGTAQQVGVAAASYAQQNFSTKKIAEQYEKLYLTVTSS
jgi:glycosyltransferase involved in cell wall biosynthesis